MKKISILVSTVDGNLKNNPAFFENIDFDICEVIVVQQLINTNEAIVLNNPSKIYTYQEKGVSLSRNRALEKVETDIILMADDDTYFIKGFEKTILSAYQKQPNAHIITFQSMNTEGNYFKKYSEKPFKHTFRTIFKISNIEVTMNLSKFNSRKLFDENYGPGSPCICGSDTVFVVDSFKKGLNMYYEPSPIVVHPPLSSGRTYSEFQTYHKGIMYRRCFGWKSFPLGLLFAIKKYNEYKDKLGFYKFVYLMWKGSLKRL
jgi:glycosyltransferase involved in cell wall biosynthesis